MTINFVCRQSKCGKDGVSPLELYVIIDGKRRYISLNRRINHKMFNPRKQIVKGDNQINEYIEAVRMKCYSLETEMLKRDFYSQPTLSSMPSNTLFHQIFGFQVSHDFFNFPNMTFLSC